MEKTNGALTSLVKLGEGQTEARFALVGSGDIRACADVKQSARYTSGDKSVVRSSSRGVEFADIGQSMKGDQCAKIIGFGKETRLDVAANNSSYGTRAWNETRWAPDGTLINRPPEVSYPPAPRLWDTSKSAANISAWEIAA